MTIKGMCAAIAASTSFFGMLFAADWQEQKLEVLDPPTISQSQPEEDEPGWDCATMGNKICGPVSADCEDQTYWWDQKNNRLIPATRTELALPICPQK